LLLLLLLLLEEETNALIGCQKCRRTERAKVLSTPIYERRGTKGGIRGEAARISSQRQHFAAATSQWQKA